MSPELTVVEQRVAVPKGTGVAGFLATIKSILKLPMVDSILINKSGEVTFKQRVPVQDEFAFQMDFAELMPYTLLRNICISETPFQQGRPPLEVLHDIFETADRDGLIPTAFFVGANTHLYSWLKQAGRPGARVLGLPVVPDRMLEDYMVFLGAAKADKADISETCTAYKVLISNE